MRVYKRYVTQGDTKAKPCLHQEDTMARSWACLRHTDGIQAHTHGLHDMCGVHPIAAMA